MKLISFNATNSDGEIIRTVTLADTGFPEQLEKIASAKIHHLYGAKSVFLKLEVAGEV